MTTLKTPEELEEMTEAELADYYYEHRDELAEHDEEPVASVKPERLDVMVSARFSLSEAAEVRAAAEKAKMSVSAFLRLAALNAMGSEVVDVERARADLLECVTPLMDAMVSLRVDPQRFSAGPHQWASFVQKFRAGGFSDIKGA